jgi:hypothetical protein
LNLLLYIKTGKIVKHMKLRKLNNNKIFNNNININ